MITVSILTVKNDEGGKVYQAIAGNRQVNGNTPGEALDAITAQLDDTNENTLIVLQINKPDAYFSVQQRNRLEVLMQKWRVSRDSGFELSSEERTELDSLVQAEIHAAAQLAKSANKL